MPMKAAVREMLPPKRMIWALEILALEQLARLAQRQGDDPLGARARRSAPAAATSDGSMSAVIGWLGSPEARISMRSIMLRSWRTLPGHDCTCSVAMASSPKRAARQALRRADALDAVRGSARGCRRAARPGPARAAAPRSAGGTGPRGTGRRRSPRAGRATTRRSPARRPARRVSPPTRRKRCSTSTRRMRPWLSRGMSATSSR